MMSPQQKTRLITRVLLIGIAIAVLSYLFHPEVGQFSVLINGQPVAEPLLRIAAVPTFLVFIGFAILITVLLLWGVGIIMLLGFLFIAFSMGIFLAPYFWPVLVIAFLFIAALSVR